jgi:hypothetical protein
MKITRGTQRAAVRAVIYGVEGIGKSTLASQFPNPLILDTEDGSRHLDVARAACPDWPTLQEAVHELIRDRQGFETVVIDSADWMERSLIEKTVRDAGKKSIEDFGFGKGYVLIAEQIGRFLKLADDLAARGCHVVFVAHSKVIRTSPPDAADGYDRYELKLSKQTAPLFKEWCDLLLFANYKTVVVEGSDGRMKARGGKDRVMHAERCAAWDAKNRFGLPETMPMAIEPLAGLFDVPKKKSWRERIADCRTVAELGDMGTAVDEAESAGRLTPANAAQARELIDARHGELEPVMEESHVG